MSQQTLNLGILAHVDAGKTTLTERLLYAAGVIDEIGSVDAGTTQTDSLDLERQRGITIKSAVVSFAIGDVKVNLIDTPGHPDFIAEVERVLGVLDGVVLVISAVEGVQSQTLVLMRALQRLHLPTLFFVNKIDRAGADDERVLHAIADRLTPAIVPMGSVRALGSRAADFRGWSEEDARLRLAELLTEHDEALLAAYVEEEATVSSARLRAALAVQTKNALVHPVFFGSAITGAGVEPLAAGIAELLPARIGDPEAEVSGRVFKIERGASGEKIAYVRLSSGTVRIRDRVRFGGELEDKVTAVSVFDDGAAARRPCVRAGEIGKLWGLGEVRIGDPIGAESTAVGERQFAPPTLESVVVAVDAGDDARLRVALVQLAEQDPLINVRRDASGELSVSLYGEVQKEVIEATLATDFGLAVGFRETTTIYIERPVGSGKATEILHAEGNPFLATIGLRVDPAAAGSGVDFRLDVDVGTVPLYVYKRVESFRELMAQYVCETLREGRFGWQVTDCTVTMIESNYSSPDGPRQTRGPLSSPADFRKLTPIVLMRALAQAGTVVCEPMVRVRVESPAAALGAVLSLLARFDADVQTPSLDERRAAIETVLPAARVHDLQRQLVAVTGGEGAIEAEFAGYHPVSGDPPVRKRTTPNPLNRAEYLLHLARRVSAG
jgi:ribosomal protection tetracycline resistance protein